MAERPTREEALSTPFAELEGYWLEIRCACGVHTYYPCRLLAKERGGCARDVLGKLRCRNCRRRPDSVALTDDATGGVPGITGERRAPWRLALLPVED